MWFWRKEYFKTLKEVAAEASLVPGWVDYAAYCIEHERGLRRQAFMILNRFISRMECAPFEERKYFVSWLLHHANLREGSHMLVPQPLHLRVINPTLTDWLLLEPMSSEPHRWLGGYQHLKQAIELDPTDEIACRRFIGCILGYVGYSTHELPSGYLGKPQSDLAMLAEAEMAMSLLSKEDNRQLVAGEIAEQKKLIGEYLAATQHSN